jgi:glycosyltransferase involved in cell wall biosynthesis
VIRGALALSVLRAMRGFGFDVAIADYGLHVASYTRDTVADFVAADALLDMVGCTRMDGVDRLERAIHEWGVSVLLQVGAPGAYSQLPYLKERLPGLRMLDMLYNEVGHTLKHFLYENCFDGVVVESRAMRDFVLANSAKPAPAVHLVESGIDLGVFAPAPRPAPGPGRATVGYVGRMSPEKNPLGFVEIAEHLHAAMPELRFRIYGEGWMAEQVRARVAAGPAAAAIGFQGGVPHARDALHAIDILVVPSLVDGRPNVVMEANACGIPVLGAPVGGIPELIVDGENGCVVDPRDHPAIAGIVSRWLRDPAGFAALRARCREAAVRHFDRRRMLEDYASVFAAQG